MAQIRRRAWLKLSGAALLTQPLLAQSLTLCEVFLSRGRMLQSFGDQKTGQVKFLVYCRDNKDILYAADYPFLSAFTLPTAEDLAVMEQLIATQLAQPHQFLPIAQQCLKYCQQTNLTQVQTQLQDFAKAPRQGSLFMEFYRTQNLEERNVSVDRFMQVVFPQRQPLDLAAIFRGANVVFLGERHDEQATKDYLSSQLELLKELGFRTFGLEFVSADDQDFLDHYQPKNQTALASRLLWKDPKPYVALVNRLVSLGIRPLGIGQSAQSPLASSGFITENRNFQLAHHVLEFLRTHPTEKLVVLTGANHAGYSQDTFANWRVLLRSHPVPDIPTLVKRYFPLLNVKTATIEGNQPAQSLFTTPQGTTFNWRYVENEIAAAGAGSETFMAAMPTTFEKRILTDSERRYDYYVHLPRT